MTRPRITILSYQQVKAYATRTGRCPECNRPVSRQRTFVETINPYNKIADKSRAKTPAEVQASVDRKAAAWDPEPEVFRHRAC